MVQLYLTDMRADGGLVIQTRERRGSGGGVTRERPHASGLAL